MDGEGERALRLLSIAGSAPVSFPWPMPLNDDKETTNEVIETIRLVCQDERETFPQLWQELDQPLRDCDTKSYQDMKLICDRFNQLVDEILQQDPEVPQRLLQGGRPSVDLLRHIIQQCYNRAVVDPEKLNQYEPFSAGVYGETSFELIDQMINTISLTEDDVFIDLGSGVGQVVLQVAAATNCKLCIGIEKANWPAQYAEQMICEFRRWMEFYGKTYSNFELIKGDFLSEEHRATISASTVIFVNNFAFGPEVDLQLKERFHDLREGSKIMSSREFRPMNMQISERNLSDIGAILTVEELSPLRGPVSWTHKPVSYFLHTIDRTQLENFYFSRRNGIKLADQPKKYVQKSRVLREGRNNRIVTRQQRLTQSKKRMRFPCRLPSRRREWLKAFPGVHHSALKLVATIQVPEKAAFVQDTEKNARNGLRALQNLHFTGREDLPIKRNCTGIQSEMQTDALTVLRECRQEKHVQRSELPIGVAYKKERSCIGKRNQGIKDPPRPKRRKNTLTDEVRSSSSTENTLMLDTRSGVSSSQAHSDVLRSVQSTGGEVAPCRNGRNLDEMLDLHILKSLLVANGTIRERRAADRSRNVREVRPRKSSMADKETKTDKRQRSGLPLSDVNGNGRVEQNARETDRTARPSGTTSNRWLFDIRLAPSPLCQVEGQIGSEVEGVFHSSGTTLNSVSEELQHESRFDKSDRIVVSSYPNRAERGFFQTKDRCKRKIRSNESSHGVLSCDDDCNASGDAKTLESVRSVRNNFNLNIAPERKTGKKTCDGSAGMHHPTERALFSHLEESLWEPCWTEDECGQEELDEALKILHQETGRVAKTGLSNPDQFNIDWMNRNARNICSTLPLPNTEPISGSSDIADPPKFFPPNDAVVSTWLLSQLKHDSDDEDECKPLDCFKASSEQKAISTHKPVHVSLPKNLLQSRCADANAAYPPTISSIPASLPLCEAVLKSRHSPDLQFRCKLSQSPGSPVSPNLSERKTGTRCKGALMASGDMKLWNTSRLIPLSVPKEALSTKQELEDIVDRNSIYDAVDCRSSSSFTGSTVSYDDSQMAQNLLPAEPEDLLESKHRLSLTDEAEIPPSLQILLDSFKSLYMNFLMYQKSPSRHRETIAEIEEQKNCRNAAVALENELNHQILQLEEENAALLKQRLLEIGIVAHNKAEFFEEANSLVLRNKFLRMQAIYIHHQVAHEQEKLFKKYEEFCSAELLRRTSFQDVFSESNLYAVDENLPPVDDLSTDDSSQVLDIALHESNLGCSRMDFALDKSIGSCVSEAADPFEACDVMPKLNLSVEYSKEDESQIQDNDAQSKSRPSSPELDMPLLMPELENLAPRGWSPVESKSAEEASGCTVRIPVKLPLRKLMRPRKPADLNLTIPLPEVDRSQNGVSSKLPPVSSPYECQPVENDRLNMYSPISQASSIENLATVDDHQEQGASLMHSFSPISSPGSVRLTSSERLCFPGECDDDCAFAAQMEMKPLQSFGAGSHQPVFDHWEHLSSQTTLSDAKFPFPPSQPFESNLCKPDALIASGELQSLDEFGSICTKLSAEQFAGRVGDGCPSYFHPGSFEDVTSSELRLKRDFSSASLPFKFEHCTSASLDISTVKPGLAEETDDATEQCKPWRRERHRTAAIKLLESPSRFPNAAKATCRQFNRNSFRPSVDTVRQMESRSDSRDSGLGKESEIDCDRFLMLHNEHMMFGAVGRGANSPRTLATCLPSVRDVLAWQPALHLQTSDSSYGRNGKISDRETFNRIPLCDSIPENPDQWPLPYSMFPDSSQSRLPSLSTFGHSPPSEHLLSEFRLSQNEMLGIHNNCSDLDRYRCDNSVGNYSQVERSADYSEMNCHQNWTDSRSVVLSAAKGLQHTNTTSLGAEHFAKSKPLFDAERWPSYLASKGCYNQKQPFATSDDFQPGCSRTSFPAPNSRLGLEPSCSPSYFNPPHSYHFYSECTV